MMLLGNQKSVFFKGVTLGIPTTLESRSMLKNNLYSIFFFCGFFFFKREQEHEVGWIRRGENLGGVVGYEIKYILYEVLFFKKAPDILKFMCKVKVSSPKGDRKQDLEA